MGICDDAGVREGGGELDDIGILLGDGPKSLHGALLLILGPSWSGGQGDEKGQNEAKSVQGTWMHGKGENDASGMEDANREG